MKEAFAALWASIVRTVTPAIIGQVLGWAASLGITLDPEFEVAFNTTLGLVFTALYYAAVRLLETYVTPKFGWLLLFPKAPVVYSTVKPADIQPAIDEAKDIVDTATAEVEVG